MPKGAFRLSGRCRSTRAAFASMTMNGIGSPSWPSSDGATSESAPGEPDSQQGIIGETVVTVTDDPETGLTKVNLITWDRPNLMADMGGAFSSMGINVMNAIMNAGPDGFVENWFVVCGPDKGAVPQEQWEQIKQRMKVTCQRRGRGKPWQERENRLRELFTRIDSVGNGYISQDDLNNFAHSLRMPKAFVHDFVDEGDQSGDGKMTFEEFAAFVRSKEISLQNAYESLNPDAKGRIRGSRLKKNLGNMEIRAGRYNSRKKIRRKGIEKMLQYVEDEQVLNANDFRDLMILIPENQLQTVSPYYMKVGLDIGTRRLPIPDRRKDGKPWGHLLAGGIAGIASKTVSSPLNVVAVRSIAGEGGASRMSAREMWSTMSHIARTEGVGGLFKGNMSNCISSAPGKAIDFFAYAVYKGLLTGNDREPTNLERLLAGSLAGMTSDSILYPLEVVSTRVTMNMSKTGATNIAQAMVEIAKKEGIRGLYSGWGAAMVGVIPYAGISFGCYDILSAQYRKFARVDSAGPLPTLGIGFISGFLASTISFPLYSATVKLQTGTLVPGLVGKQNLVSVMRYTIAKDGYKGLFNGWLPASTKMIPQAGISFVVYEMVKRRLDQSNYVDVEADEDLEIFE